MKRLIKYMSMNMLNLKRKDFIKYMVKKTRYSKNFIIKKFNEIYYGIANKDEKMTRMVFIDYIMPRGLMFNESQLRRNHNMKRLIKKSEFIDGGKHNDYYYEVFQNPTEEEIEDVINNAIEYGGIRGILDNNGDMTIWTGDILHDESIYFNNGIHFSTDDKGELIEIILDYECDLETTYKILSNNNIQQQLKKIINFSSTEIELIVDNSVESDLFYDSYNIINSETFNDLIRSLKEEINN